MRKILMSSVVAISAFAFAGMSGGGMKAHNMSPMKGLTDNKVVAEINGKKVRVKDINAYMQGMTKDFRIKLQELPAQHVGEFVKKYIDTETYYESAKEITKTPQYKALMKKLAVDLWMTQQYNKIKVSDKEVKEFFCSKVVSLFGNEEEEIKAGDTIGVIAVELNLGLRNKMLNQRDGLGKTGQIYLVGSDYLLRSDFYLSKDKLLIDRLWQIDFLQIDGNGLSSGWR